MTRLGATPGQLSSPPVVGFVGAGQLARMTVQAAIPLGVTVRLLAARPDDGAALVSPHVAIGQPDDAAALTAFAERCDVVTFDHELVDVALLEQLEAAGHVLRPSAATIAIAQDKRRQRETFAALSLPLPPFRVVATVEEIAAFAAEHGWPVVLKAQRGGYDGRGVWVVDGPPAAEAVVAQAQAAGLKLLGEGWVAIEREVAALVARRPNGETVSYPLVETVQRDGICHELAVPAPLSPELAEEARRLALVIAEATGVVGILAVELFVSGGRLLINEIATRPHNSGHWTIEGAVTSQFENHLRAVLNWPLGCTDPTAPAVATANVLGPPGPCDLLANLPDALALPGVHIHLYGKEARPGRKLGHVTVTGDDVAPARERAIEGRRALTNPAARPR